MDIRSPLMVLAVGLLALSSGCLTADKKSESKKPDVTQSGVLPPPQAMVRPVGGGPGDVIPASATMPASPVGVLPAPAGSTGPSFSKLTAKLERKVIATEMAVGWQNRVAYLPDPVRNGQMSPGIAGQMFLFGGAKLEFAQADGTLTVDLLDETPRPPGQPAATPERWQFDKNTLRNLQTRDETFGKSYVLFLPWPSYKSDITKVRISARYDPDNGHTLYAAPSAITIDTASAFGSPVFSPVSTSTRNVATGARPLPFGASSMTGLGGMPAGGVPPVGTFPPPGAPIPLGGGAPAPLPGAMMPGMPANPMVPEGSLPLTITLPGTRP